MLCANIFVFRFEGQMNHNCSSQHSHGVNKAIECGLNCIKTDLKLFCQFVVGDSYLLCVTVLSLLSSVAQIL